MTKGKYLKRFSKLFQEFMNKEPLYPWACFISFLLCVCCLALPLWRIVPLADTNPFLPLHYNVYFGVDRFGPWYHIFFLPALGFLFFLLNTALQMHFFRSEKLLSRFLAISTMFIEVTFVIAMILIILLNL
ncbi:MAG: hypothetical protein AAB431_04195 [Patescibacteria group bacterium]